MRHGYEIVVTAGMKVVKHTSVDLNQHVATLRRNTGIIRMIPKQTNTMFAFNQQIQHNINGV